MKQVTRQDDPSPAGSPLEEVGSGREHPAPEVRKEPRQGEIRPKLEMSIKGSLSILAILAVVALLYYAASVVITVFSSILIAIALEPGVGFLCRRARLSRPIASLILVFVAIMLLYGALYFAYNGAEQLLSDLPTLLEQIRRTPLVQEISRKVQDLSETIVETGRSIAPAPAPPKGGDAQVVIRDGSSWIDALLRGIGSLTTLVFSLSFIPFLVYFILAEKDALTRRTLRLFPPEQEERVRDTLRDIEKMMEKFLVGNAIIAAALSAGTVGIFGLIGLPYWGVLGILSGISSTIPYLGLFLALLPGVLVGLVSFDSGLPFVVLVGGVALLHVLAANLLIPKFVGSRAHLNAVTSTMALMFFGWLWGGMGLLLAIPIVAVLRSVLQNVESTRALGEWLGD